jgi:hypothetical protein
VVYIFGGTCKYYQAQKTYEKAIVVGPSRHNQMTTLTPAVIKGFVGSLLASRYDDALPTPPFHLEMWAYCCSDHKLVSIAAPRYHSKSTAITHAYTLASLLFRESDYCILVSDTETQAIEFLSEIKKDLLHNDDLIELFGIAGLTKDTETDIICEFTSKTNGETDKFRVVAKGVGQRLRGLKWNQKRPNLIIMDDCENTENAASKEQRDKLKRWCNGTLIPCMAKRGKLRGVGTVVHSDSWLAGTLPDEQSPLTVHDPLKTYSRRLTHGWHSIKYRGHPAIGDYSQFLWPEHRSLEFFKSEYERLEADGQVDVYSAEQLNNPIDETHAYFKKTDFVDIPAEARKRRLIIQSSVLWVWMRMGSFIWSMLVGTDGGRMKALMRFLGLRKSIILQCSLWKKEHWHMQWGQS